MKGFIKWMDKAPKLLKIIFALPGLALIWGIYRLCRSIDKNNVLGIVLGIVMIFVDAAVLWILDIITIILKDKVLWID